MIYFLIAGEASGDLHAANLIRTIKTTDSEAKFVGFGGDLMEKEGMTILKHYKDMAFMGFIPVLMNLGTVMKNMSYCKRQIVEIKPDAIILIDYPGFNLRIAKYVKTKLELPIFYYISPKVWAWKEYRVKSFKKYVDKMLCILPFEIDFFKKHNYDVTYVGNPTLDEVAEYKRNHTGDTFDIFATDNNLPHKPIIAILCGSRTHEIKNNLPTMLLAAKSFPSFQIVIAGAPGISLDFYDSFTHGYNCSIVRDETYRLLTFADIALVTSGTATLETALFYVPQVVCYKTMAGPLVNWYFENMMNAPYISLVNLIAGKPVVRELFGKYFSTDNIVKEIKKILFNTDYKAEMITEYERIEKLLGKEEAPKIAAKEIIQALHTLKLS